MGAEFNSSNGKADSSIDSTAGGNTGKPTAGYNSAGDSSAGGKTGGKTGDSTGAAGAAGAAKEKEKPAAVPAIEKDNEVPAPPKPQKKATRKKAAKKKKEPEVSYNAAQLQALILSGSAIIASRDNMQMFALSPEEAQQLANPIANMIEKSEKLQNMGEYADAIALVTAAMLIFIPRFILYADVKKKDKLSKNGGVKLVREKPKTHADNRRNDGQPAEQPKDDGQDFRSILSPVDGF